MILEVGDVVRSGRAIDCPVAVSPTNLARAVRHSDSIGATPECRIRCRSPGPVHRHVGCIHPDMGLKVRTALARAGRARGCSTPFDDRIAALQQRLVDFDDPGGDPAAERRAVAARTESTAERSEAVAARRGRVAARRAVGAEVDEAQTALEDAVADLAEVETAAVAARQAHERKLRATRRARDRLSDRLAVEDALANARRDARSWLVDRLSPAYRAALQQVPGRAPVDAPFEAPPELAALAVARVARPAAPIVLEVDRFPDAAAAAAWLAGPVVRV
jgi:hypothetical protein